LLILIIDLGLEAIVSEYDLTMLANFYTIHTLNITNLKYRQWILAKLF